MRTYFQAFRVRLYGCRTVAALVAIGVCVPALAADFRSLQSRVRRLQSFSAPSGSAGSAFRAPLQTQVSDSTAGRTLGKRKLNSTTGSMAGSMQLDPNAGHTLGKRRLNTGSAVAGMGLTQPWQKSRVVAAPNGNTGITGAGLPTGMASRVSNAARVATPQPQQVMTIGSGDLINAVAGHGLDWTGAPLGQGTLPPSNNPGPTNGGTLFQDVEEAIKDTVDPNAGHSIGKKKLDPNANHSIGRKKKFDTGALAGKYDPNASTSVQLPSMPNGVGNGGGASPNPMPPTTPGPAPAPQGNTGGGFPWQDVVVGTALGLANRPVAYETPVYVPVAQPAVQQVVVNEAPAAVEAEPVEAVQGSADLVLENIEQAEPATMLVGPAYRVTFRNQSASAVGAFRVAIFAGSDGKPTEDAPRAVMEIAGLEGGEVGEATLRLPAAAMKMVSTNSELSGFSHLIVAVDVTRDVAELDETNNVAIVERSALDAATK